MTPFDDGLVWSLDRDRRRRLRPGRRWTEERPTRPYPARRSDVR